MYLDNKYTIFYNSIILAARNRNITTKKEAKRMLGYVERHHIIPKSLGGDNSAANLVYLTGREHFICHWLLSKMTTGSSRELMLFALNMMRCNGEGQHRYNNTITSKVYERIKSEIAVIRRRKQLGTTQSKESNVKRRNTQLGKAKGAQNTTIFTFYHYTGITMRCTCYELYKNHGADQGNLTKLISPHSKVKCVNGWALSPNTAGKKGFNQRGINNPANDKKLYTFHNKLLSITEHMTQFDFRNKYGLCKSNVSAVVRQRQKSYKDWIIL
jgi:hypothetical protein